MKKHVTAILWKQLKDTLKNKEILIQFLMFPLLTIVMENSVNIEGMAEHFFANLFGVMYIGMAPLTSMAAIIAEEKEKNTLRVLFLANVKPLEYLLGVGCYIFAICMTGAGVIAWAGGYKGKAWICYVMIMAVGELVSIVIGAAIGVWGKNQMAATSLTVPVMLVFSFLPMLSMFNKTISGIAKFTYSQQIHLLMNQVENLQIETENVAIIGVNMFLATVLFVAAYKTSASSYK